MTTAQRPDHADTIAETLENADTWWRDCAQRALEHLADNGAPFTTDDIRDLGVGEPDHPNRWGALFQAALRGGRIKPTGYALSRRRSRHGGIVRIWQGGAQW